MRATPIARPHLASVSLLRPEAKPARAAAGGVRLWMTSSVPARNAQPLGLSTLGKSARPTTRFSTATDGGSHAGSVRRRCEPRETLRLRREPPTLIDPLADPKWERRGDAEVQAESRPPAHEVVEWHLTYLAEAYLPSHAEQLRGGLRRAGWSKDRFKPSRDPVPSLRRSSFGGGWTHLGILVPESADPRGHVQPAVLPDGVASVRLALWSVTPSLTVLVAAFEWDDDWAEALHRIAWTDYETALLPIDHGRRILDPFHLKELDVSRRRRDMRRHLSSWLANHLPGAFTDLGTALPALDVITTAQAQPFADDPPLVFNDYRSALSLDSQFQLGSSPSLPGWILALPDRGEQNVLTLAGRTMEVFDERLLGRYGGGVSRWGLADYLMKRVEDLVCSWAAVCLLGQIHRGLASTRDRAPTADESPAAFARRLSRDLNQVLRRGADASAYCGDILRRPENVGPLHVLRGLDFVLTSPWRPTMALGDAWSTWLTQEATLVQHMEHEQQTRLATITQLSGLLVNVRTQDQMRVLAVVAVLVAVAAVVIAVLQS
jgi:hypothetical protein